MKRIAIPISILSVLMLGACAGTNSAGPPALSNPVAQQMAPYRPGSGVVQSVTPAPSLASAGGTTPGGVMQRLAIRMDDGRVLYVDTASTGFTPGTRVQLTENREIVRQ